MTKVRHLFAEIRHRGYTGSFTHLARFLAPWRNATFPRGRRARSSRSGRVRTRDPMTGRLISPLTAAALCVKPRGQMSARQVVNVDALKAASDEFIAMRSLALRFRGLLRGGTAERLDTWLDDARIWHLWYSPFCEDNTPGYRGRWQCRLEPWSNGQTEGQINKLKTLKRAMYGRAGVHLLRARMTPL